MGSSFQDRVALLPVLGMGLSTEYGAAQAEGSLSLFEVKKKLPHCASVLELGIEVDKGLDTDALQWIEAGWPTTYHFLDINLHEPEDFTPFWVQQVKALIEKIKPAWLCGDAGLWHHGPRASGHMLLLPPILSKDSAYALADGIIRLREETGLEVFPENPPGHVYVGPLHLLEFFAIVCERADTGMLLDLAHLAIFQQSRGYQPSTGLKDFPLDRVVELHMAGGDWHDIEGLALIEDSHTPHILPETWEAFTAVAPHLTELRAVIFECERNPFDQCASELENLYQALKRTVTPLAPLHQVL